MTPRRVHLISLRNHWGQHDAQPQPSASKSRCSWCRSDHPSDGTWCWTRFDKMGVDVRQVGSHQHRVIDSDRKKLLLSYLALR